MKKITTSLLSLLLVLGITSSLQASTIKVDDHLRITESVDHNLYVAAGELDIDADIFGDLVAAAGEVDITGTIHEDVTLAGGDVDLRGLIHGDLRVIGGSFHIRNDVLGDLVITGGEVSISEGVTIGGDLIVAGGEVRFAGIVQGDVHMAGGEVRFRGFCQGDFNAKAGELTINGTVHGSSSLSAQSLRIGSDARFESDVKYWTKEGEVNFKNSLAEGVQAEFSDSLKVDLGDFNRKTLKQGLFAFTIFRVFAAALLIILMIALFNRFFSENAGRIKKEYFADLGYGAILFLGVPIAAGLACITIIGIPAGLIMFSVFGISVLLSHSLTAVVAAYEMEHHLNRSWGKGTIMLVSLGAFILLKVIGSIPFFGGLVTFIITMIAFGYIIKSLTDRRRRGKVIEIEVEDDHDTDEMV